MRSDKKFKSDVELAEYGGESNLDSSVDVSNQGSSPTTSLTDIDQTLYDSILPQFHPNIFLFQFLIHLFPIFLILASPNSYAQGIRWDTFYAIRFNIISPCMFYIMIACYSILLTSTSNGGEIVANVAFGNPHAAVYVIPVMFFLVYRMGIAWKYATMSPTEYQR